MTDLFLPFRFKVSLYTQGNGQLICGGSFSEVSGLEASMEVKTLREGGRNYGEVQLAGQTTFATIVLKRGVTEIGDLWSWFDITTQQGNYGYRLSGEIDVLDPGEAEKVLLRWKLSNCMATKFKGPDLSATAAQIAIEELELVHEGLNLERPDSGRGQASATGNGVGPGAGAGGTTSSGVNIGAGAK
ncbi:MAG TPA: phage tail protein [Candidatus Tenderia sp.]|nr:phage tail protein [Candidatus Tenderia sp.]